MNQKPNILFTILLLLLIPSIAVSGVINTKIDLSCKVDKKNDIAVHAVISNTGNSTAYKTTLSFFMENWAQKFDDLGDNLPGGKIKFDENIGMPELKPGRHILVARVSFEEQSGISHRIYEYFPFSYKTGGGGKEPLELSLELKPPLFNSRAFWEKKKEMNISVKNPNNYPVLPVISFYLSDGYTAGDASIAPEVPPDKTITEAVVIEKDKSIGKEGKILSVAWYEKDGVIYSVKSEGIAGLEEKPVLFKWYVLFSAIFIIALTVMKTIKRGWRKA